MLVLLGKHMLNQNGQPVTYICGKDWDLLRENTVFLILYSETFMMQEKMVVCLYSFLCFILFQRFPPLEFDSLQVYILRDTLFSSTFVNEELIWLRRLAWWRRRSVFYLGCQGGFFWALRRRNFFQMAACASAHAHAQGEVSPYPRQLTPIKTAVFAINTSVLAGKKNFVQFFSELELVMSHDF